MTGRLVRDQYTPFSIDQLIVAMAAATRTVMGANAPAHCMAALTAQACLETGNGQYCYCHGIGNVKRSASWAGDYCQRICTERFSPARAQAAIATAPPRLEDSRLPSAVVVARQVDQKAREIWVVKFWPPHHESEFRAFETLELGCVDYVELLACTDRYRDAWSQAYHGQVGAFVRSLCSAGYFTADVEAYARAVELIAERILPVCIRALSWVEHGVDDELRQRVSDITALTLAMTSRDERYA